MLWYDINKTNKKIKEINELQFNISNKKYRGKIHKNDLTAW